MYVHIGCEVVCVRFTLSINTNIPFVCFKLHGHCSKNVSLWI